MVDKRTIRDDVTREFFEIPKPGFTLSLFINVSLITCRRYFHYIIFCYMFSIDSDVTQEYPLNTSVNYIKLCSLVWWQFLCGPTDDVIRNVHDGESIKMTLEGGQ